MTEPRRPARRAVRHLLPVLSIMAAVPVLHRFGPALHGPYWLDEAWVADAARVPLGALPKVTVSTPLGFTFLVWLLPAHGQVHRLIPLAFLAGSVVGGYAFARALGGPERRALLAGLAAAAAALLLPAQQVRHDLKQYTADAALTLLLLTLLAWAEAGWSRRRAGVLAAAIVGGMLVSHVAALAGAAVVGGVLAAGFVTGRDARRRRAFAGRCGWAAATAAGMALVYLVVDRSARTPAMTGYWSAYFPAPAALPGYLLARLAALRPALGAPWPWFVLLAAGGVVVVARRGRPATAVATVLLPVGAALAGLVRVYPLLDQRTSHFLLVTGAVLAGLALAEAAGYATRHRWPAAAAVTVLVLAGYALVNRGALAGTTPPGGGGEDTRAQARYVAGHRRPGDVVLVNMSGQFGFAYYWPGRSPQVVRGGVQATNWYVRYPSADRIVVAAGRDPASVAAALRTARDLAGRADVWLVRSHVNPAEAAAWRSALAGTPVRLVPVGPEPVAVLEPPDPEPAAATEPPGRVPAAGLEPPGVAAGRRVRR